MILLALATLVTPPPAKPPAAEPLLVTTDWLAKHLNDKGLIIFQIGDQATQANYAEGHIPGAQFLAPLREFSTPRVEGALALELPAPDVLAATLQAKGVSNDSRIVLYWAKEYYSPTSRALFTLEYAGLAGRVSILDGGYELWKKEGHPVTAEVPAVTAGHFVIHPNPDIVADAEYVKAHLDDKNVRILDARDTAFFNGRDTRQGRNGHIPGATSLYFGSIIDTTTGRFLAPAALKARFTEAGVTDKQTVVTYCHIGQQATFVWFAARSLGYTAKLYDGSFQDWAKRTDLPVVNPSEGKPE